MNKKKKEKLQELISLLLLFGVIAASIYVFVFYRAADGKIVEAFSNEADYEVYSGRNAYEYWKTTLDENQQILYDEIKESYLQFNDTFSSQAKKMSINDSRLVYSAVMLDHPEIFWMDSYQPVTTFDDKLNTNKKIELYYAYDKEEVKEIKAKIEPKYQEIIDEAQKLDNNFKKIKFVHDKLIEMSTYTDYSKDELHEFQSIVSIFDTGDTVCAGYSYGFKFIMDELGIDSIVSRDISNEDKSKNHIWNMVNLYGKWYNLDITWDEHYTENGVIAYNYFLKENEEFYKDHKMQPEIPQNKE